MFVLSRVEPDYIFTMCINRRYEKKRMRKIERRRQINEWDWRMENSLKIKEENIELEPACNALMYGIQSTSHAYLSFVYNIGVKILKKKKMKPNPYNIINTLSIII